MLSIPLALRTGEKLYEARNEFAAEMACANCGTVGQPNVNGRCGACGSDSLWKFDAEVIIEARRKLNAANRKG